MPAGSAPAAGLGLDSADVRARMVERLRAEGVAHPRVLAAFAAVPRHLFVDAALATQAYEDTSLPIGHGQTISKPSVVARMLELLFGGRSAPATPATSARCSRSAPAAATRRRCCAHWAGASSRSSG